MRLSEVVHFLTLASLMVPFDLDTHTENPEDELLAEWASPAIQPTVSASAMINANLPCLADEVFFLCVIALFKQADVSGPTK